MRQKAGASLNNERLSPRNMRRFNRAATTPVIQAMRILISWLRIDKALVSALMLAAWIAGSSVASVFPQSQEVSEYQIKAAFLYNFAKFVEWPAASFKDSNSPIAICVVGQNPFGAILEETVNGKKLEGRHFVVRNITADQLAGGCHILFVSSSERKHSRAILESIKTPGVLTVGEVDGFAMDGGVINFKLDGGKLRFEINPEAAAKEGLQIRSNLLSLAQIVKP
jgi:hypothetical protein